MLAVMKTKPEKGIEIVDCPIPSLTSPKEVLIKVEACGVCGSDLHFYEWKEYIRDDLTLPRILGHEVSGTVVEVGSDIKDFKPGDRVVTETWGGCGDCYYCRLGKFNHCLHQTRIGQKADGGMTNYLLITGNSLYHIPSSIPFDEAAVIEPVGVALRGWECAKYFKPGDSVVVIGPGPIGMFAGLIGKIAGANEVIMVGTTNSAKRLELAEQHGMQTVNIDDDSAYSKVLSLTKGRGAELVIDTSGGRESLSQAIKFAKLGGEIILVGISPDSIMPLSSIVNKGLSIVGSFRRLPHTWERAINLVHNYQVDVRPFISHVLPITKVEEAFQLLQNRQAMKIILKPVLI